MFRSYNWHQSLGCVIVVDSCGSYRFLSYHFLSCLYHLYFFLYSKCFILLSGKLVLYSNCWVSNGHNNIQVAFKFHKTITHGFFCVIFLSVLVMIYGFEYYFLVASCVKRRCSWQRLAHFQLAVYLKVKRDKTGWQWLVYYLDSDQRVGVAWCSDLLWKSILFAKWKRRATKISWVIAIS